MTSLDRETEYLAFQELDVTTKTRQWAVKNKHHGDLLGLIKWYGPWRTFTFQALAGTIFNRGCLADVDRFLVDAYQDWRTTRS